jgi:phosphotransferase system  glucose/maltose/N-acetylglucosamine-specific IIC component
MSSNIFIALTGALINVLLSVIVPCLTKKSDMPFLQDARKVFETNRQIILTSSLIIAITIYLALEVAPELDSTLSELSDIGGESNDNMPTGLRNLFLLSRERSI